MKLTCPKCNKIITEHYEECINMLWIQCNYCGIMINNTRLKEKLDEEQ